MSTLSATLAALLPTAALLALLAWRDPKRLRSGGAGPVRPLPRGPRRLLGWLAPLPGLLLALMGLWPALLIWLGLSGSLGWALTQALAPSSQTGSGDSDGRTSSPGHRAAPTR